MSKDKSNEECLILDTILEDKSYDNISFSSAEDIKQFLDNFDIFYMEALDGNLNALCLIEDFSSLVYDDNGQPLCDMLCQYIKIKSGQKKVLDKNGEEMDCIIQQLATENGRWVRTINKMLDEEIDFVIKKNNEIWLKTVKRKYDVNCSKQVDGHTEIVKDKEMDRALKEKDFEIKYGRFKRDKKVNMQQEYPQQLKDLEEMYNINEQNLGELEEIKERNEDEKKEFNKRIKMKKDLLEDIKYIKDIYEIPYEETHTVETFGDRNRFLYDDYMDESMNISTEDAKQREDNVNRIKVDKINSVAKETLTDKEFKIYTMYYISNLNQNQIADIIGDSQSTISRNLTQIISKIKKSLKDL